ncbi:MAG: hypothetical protein IJY61_06965 [Candidatus Gastranaerophilales bacterium]|nr:hypothetical protein [Alphaproteobacteria bacterium]MBQ8887423.1 hypothetical protein [Candidatus Gastranaerophilales bacterium]
MKNTYFNKLMIFMFLCLGCLTGCDNKQPKIGEDGFELKISCTMRNQELALAACIGASKTVKVTTSNGSKVYTGYELMQRHGKINVPEHFSFAAYNESDHLILQLEVFDYATGKIIYTDQAGSYDAVYASN